MLGFIQLTQLDGTPVLLNVAQIVDVWEPRGTPCGQEKYADLIRCGITTSNQVNPTSSEAWFVLEHYPAVLALIARAGAKVVR